MELTTRKMAEEKYIESRSKEKSFNLEQAKLLAQMVSPAELEEVLKISIKE